MRVFVWVLSFLLLAACDDSSGPTGGDGGSGPACPHPASQPLSSPCCPEHGIDACGAQLFCAAFDGRTVPTCFAERSRLAGESCTEDRQCLTGSCNQAAGACRAGNLQGCTPEVGCAPSESFHGLAFACHEGRCRAVEYGNVGDVCLEDVDCLSRECVDATCTAPRCGIGTGGLGPCARYWPSEDCYECIGTDLFYCEADLSPCNPVESAYILCMEACKGDERCQVRECGDLWCGVAECLNRQCEWVASCF